MKVLQVGKFLPPIKGGMESSILHLCENLHDREKINIVLSAVGKSKPNFAFPVRPLHSIFTVASTPIAFGLLRSVREERPDLIHVHLPNPWVTVSLLPVLFLSGVPVVATYHCDVITYPLLKKIYRPFLKTFLKRCRWIVATSPQLLEHNNDLRSFAHKTKMISLSAPPIPDGEEIRKKAGELAAKTQGKAIVFIGRLVAYKGLPYLIKAMQQVDAHLFIVGGGRERFSLEQKVAELGLKEKITFSGEVTDEEIPVYLRAARVLVLPSINEAEALGISLIEALSAGVPLITTDLPTGVSYVNQNGVTGKSVPTRDSKALAAALQELLTTPELEQKFRENALKRYQEVFSTDRIVSAYRELYHQAIAP